MQSEDDIRPISHLAVREPGPSRAPATQGRSKCSAPAAQGRGGLKYANPQDKYILILLEYKLMLLLTG